MISDAATVIAYVGAFVGLVGGGVALFNSWKAVSWKRAELANSYLRDFDNNPELVFAGRCLDWNGGRLDSPREPSCLHARSCSTNSARSRSVRNALRPDLSIDEIDKDPRTQVYRTSIDSFLSWLSLVASALDRKLFMAADMEEIGYWVAKIQSDPALIRFVIAYGYAENIDKLIRRYRHDKTPYKNWVFPPQG